jgi:hypothetical protein
MQNARWAHAGTTAMDAHKLRLVVADEARELCRVDMPVLAVDNIVDLFPDEDRAAVAAAGCDLASIRDRVQRSGYAPQVLVDVSAGERRYRLWIE